MSFNPVTPLKWGAVMFAVFWTDAMLWWIRSAGPVEIFIFGVCGATGGYGWYRAMCFAFRCIGLLPPERGETAEARRGKLYPWIVWAGAMVVSGIVSVWLLDLANPFIPAGEWQRPTMSLFVIFVWPGLMWSLRPMIRRHLPPRRCATWESTA